MSDASDSFVQDSRRLDSGDFTDDDDDIIEDSFTGNNSVVMETPPKKPPPKGKKLGSFFGTPGWMDVSMTSVGTPRGADMDVSMRTPRNVKAVIDSSSSSEDEDDSAEIVEISSDEEPPATASKLKSPPRATAPPKMPAPQAVPKRVTPPHLLPSRAPVKVSSISPPQVSEKTQPPLVMAPPAVGQGMISVDSIHYKQQEDKVRQLATQLGYAKTTIQTINLATLKDKGKNLLDKEAELRRSLDRERNTLSKMIVNRATPEEPLIETAPQKRVQEMWQKNVVVPASGSQQSHVNMFSWNDIQSGLGAVQPKHFGKIGMATFQKEKAMALDRLEDLHGSIKTCPTDNILAEDPKGLKVELMEHQKRALGWLTWRETQKPRGGILADDMGLGKTLTMISLIMKQEEKLDEKEDEEEEEEEEEVEEGKKPRKKYPGGTLIVAPASLIGQWEGEITKRVKRGMLSVELYHGQKRETSARELARRDIVITTYTIITNERNNNGPPFKIRWKRIVLDEGHTIRNHKSQGAEACCKLVGNNRWVLTGTPVHNKELDMYGLLKFLRCSPFDDLRIWKHWVGDKSSGGQERLHTIISSLMLRRTKVELMAKGEAAFTLPGKEFELIEVAMNSAEMHVYQKILLFSKTLFAKFLHQRAEKNQETFNMPTWNAPNDPNNEYTKMRQALLKFNRTREVSQHEILVLLLRLRQICCHPSLIKEMLKGDEDLGAGEDADAVEEENLLDQLNKLDIKGDEENSSDIGNEAVSMKEAVKGYLSKSNPVFDRSRVSSKIHKVLDVLKTIDKKDKIVIVSQWTSFLEIIGEVLKKDGMAFLQLDGKIPVNKRMPIVDKFNNPNDSARILLLSLTAGGVGLNLVGGNVLLLLDLHWNPQLENQAQDRIYRLGQKKVVKIFKFMVKDSIEESIKQLQDNKLQLANAMLTGSKQMLTNKLSLADLKMLFNM